MAQRVVAGRYRLGERLGVGGMSEVWAADDLELGRRVALKLLGTDADPARFEREAHAAAALSHPNICQLYDYGDADGRPFMVLEYLGGGSLEERLVPGGPHPDDETGRIARELAAGLAHAHARGLVHRDLKPGNVLFDDEGRAKIADFGIARIGGAGTLTEAGTVLGTAAYISPEQAQGLPATAASDVYSFGVILYRMLTGRLPFESEQPLELATMHVNEEPPPLEALRPDAPPELANLAEASLAKDPETRPPDGAALVEALGGAETTVSDAPTAVFGTAPTQMIPPPAARPPQRRARSNALPLALAALIVLAGGGVALAYLATRDSGSSNAPTPPPTPVHATRATSTHAAATTKPAATSTHATTTAATTSTRAQTPPPPPPPPPPPTTTAPPPPPPPTATTTVPATTAPATTTAPPPSPPPPPPPPSP